MLTSPKETVPFQRGRAMSATVLQFQFGRDPVVEVHSVAAAAFEIAMIGAHPDVVGTRFRGHRDRRRSTVPLHRLYAVTGLTDKFVRHRGSLILSARHCRGDIGRPRRTAAAARLANCPGWRCTVECSGLL